MWKWVLPITVVVVISGVAIMIAWTAVNQLLAGQGAAIDWTRTLLSLLVIILAAGGFVAFANTLAVASEQKPTPR